MFRNECFRCSALTLVLLVPSVVARAQDTAITGARFTLVEKSEAALTVTIENLRDAPLVVWEIATVRDGSSRPITIHWKDRSSTTRQDASDDGPVRPRGRRTETIHVGNTGAVAAIMHLAIFADGYYEGPGADSYLQRHERLPIVDRPMVPGPLQRSSDVPSVGISSTPSTTSRLYGVVENLRDVPIEAFGFQQYEEGRLRGGSASDFYGIRGASIGSGPIQPGERREIALSWEKNPDGSLPDVKLHFVLFEDLKFEGSSAGRDSILKSRQQRSTSKC